MVGRLDDGSKGGEILLVDDLLTLALVLVTVLTSLFRLTLSLIEETETLQVLIKTNPTGCVLDHILAIALADFLALLGIEDGQLLLLDPLSIDFSRLLHLLLLVGGSHLQTLALVVLFQSQGLRFFGFLFSWRLFGSRLSTRFLHSLLRSLFNVLIFVELVLDVSDISPSAALLPRLVSVSRIIYTLPVPLLRSR